MRIRPSGSSVGIDARLQMLDQSYEAKISMKRLRCTNAKRSGLVNEFTGLGLLPKPINQQQLASEIRGMSGGLVMVENKCVHIVDTHSQSRKSTELDDSMTVHFQALSALHRTLLYEYHGFFLASQHSSASPSLQYSMPARMWKHGIYSFLDLLIHHLRELPEYMLALLPLAYQKIGLLYGTVPAFEDTWIACLGDLGRYRMAIEDEDWRDREVWTGVARFWYMKARDKTPRLGRLYRKSLVIFIKNSLFSFNGDK